jgi:hypothetical protein
MPDSLNVGDVFLARNVGLSGDAVHYHIVVYKSEDNSLVVVYTTKEIEKTEKRCRRNEQIPDYIETSTMIIISDRECDSLSQTSAINCNNVHFQHESFYLNLPAFKLLNPLKDMSIIPKIIKAITESRIVPDNIINLLANSN